MGVSPGSLCLAVCAAIVLVLAPTGASGEPGIAQLSGAPPAVHVVTLPTGEEVGVYRDPSGRQAALVSPSSREGPSGLVYKFELDGHLYVIPWSALPRIGNEGSLSRFDVTRLAGLSSGGTGQLDSAANENRAYDMRTLTIKGIDVHGQPAQNMVYAVLNVDDMRDYARLDFSGALTKLSVPVGPYCVIGFFTDHDSATGRYAERIVTVPDFQVSADDSSNVITLDARQATSKLQVQTPRPATPQILDVGIGRAAERLGEATFGFDLPASTFDVYVAPTDRSLAASEQRPVEHGQLHFYDYWRLTAPDGSYTYDVEFPKEGAIPSDTDYDVTDDELATVSADYRADVAGRTESEQRFSYLPWQVADVQDQDPPLTTPLHRTEYVMGDPQIEWLQQKITLLGAGLLIYAGWSEDSYRSYEAGQHVDSVWQAQPVHPSVQADFGVNPGNYFLCPACREGNTLNLAIYPFGDNQFGHVTLRDAQAFPGAGGLQESTEFDVYAGDTLIARGQQAFGSVALPPEPTTYHLVYDNTRKAPWWSLSTTQQTEWTFTSSTAQGSGTLPKGWYCDPTLGTACAVVPLLLADYDLPTSDLGAIAPGPVSAGLTVTHLQSSSSSPVTATLQVSFDDGATWQDATLTDQGSGRFTAEFTVPPADATDGYGSLRLTATDADGSQLHQTILHAFAVASDSGSTSSPASAAAPDDPNAAPTQDSAPGTGEACAELVAPAHARCFALLRKGVLEAHALGAEPAAPAGYGPADLQAAYALGAAAAERGGGQTVAIVDAYDDPSAETDLGIYRSQYGLPACTTANGCFAKLNQEGEPGPYPRADYGWALEISLDLDMVSAACPNCRILLVEADSNSLADLAQATDTAANFKPAAISNSYGADEFAGMSAFAAAYDHPGTLISVASGDSGFGIAQFPAVLPTVVTVGGTTLQRSDNARGWTETAWGHGPNSSLAGGAGSGCSAYIEKPSWQHDPRCHTRMVADVSADADPGTGVALYDTYHRSGWLVAGGTSAGAPLIAGISALAENRGAVDPADLYRNAPDFNDVVGGSNGYCRGDYHCTGSKNYDGPTGLGTPEGYEAFSATDR